jgi:hypothetical protein
MTLVLSLATQHFVVQVSDRKVTHLDTGEAMSLNTNKMVLFCNRMAFGFTGPSAICDATGGLIPTDNWLAKSLHELPLNSSVSDAAHSIAKKATAAVAKTKVTKSKHRKLAFIGIGWGRRHGDDRFFPAVCRVSNFHDAYGQHRDEPREEFTVELMANRNAKSFGWIATGVPFDQAIKAKLTRQLRKCASHSTGPMPAIELMVRTVRSVADDRPSVGRDVLTAMIPRGAAGINAVFLLNERTRSGVAPYYACEHALQHAMQPENLMKFRFYPDNSESSIEYGPIMVWPNRYLITGMEAGLGDVSA